MGFIKLQDVLKQCRQQDAIKFLDDPNLAIHFSQFGEDIVITELLLRRKPKGFYVDVGAHHPERYSNTRLLSLAGWRGMNIDAHEESIDVFKKERPDDLNIHCAVSTEEGEVEFYRFLDPAVNTISPEQVAKWKSSEWIPQDSVTVRSRRLDSLFGEYLDAGQFIDFLNIDVEGIDLDVLKSNNFDAFRPSVIAIEIHGFKVSNPAESPTYDYLFERGYRLHSFVHVTAIFKDKAF